MLLVLQYIAEAVQQNKSERALTRAFRRTFLKSSKPVDRKYLLRFAGTLVVGSLTGFIVIPRLGFEDLESCAVAFAVMTLGNKNRKKKGLVATLGRKTAKKLQATFRQTDAKTTGDIKPSGTSCASKDLCDADGMRTPTHEEDSFVTSLTHLNTSLPSSSSGGSYVTAFCESDKMRKLLSASTSPNLEVEKGPPPPDADGNEPLLPGRQGSFDTDSGKGGSPPPPPQREDIGVPNLDANDVTTASTLRPSVSRKNSLEFFDKEIRNVQAILDELQSKTVSDDVKAKNLASLNRVILQCKDYMQRYSVRQDLMSLGLLNALPNLIESRNRGVETELEIFFASESNDNLVGGGIRHPIDTFQAAYVKLKHSTAAEILLDILEVVAKIQPSGKRLRSALHVLQRGHLRSEGVQTDAGLLNEKTSVNDVVPLAQDVGNHLTVIDPLALSSSAPLPQIIRRPRSTSRVRRRGERRSTIEVKNIPYIDDDGPPMPNESSEKRTGGPKNSPKSSHSRESHGKHSLEKPPTASIAPPAPPLPPPPPPPEFLNTSLAQKTSGSPVVVKSGPVYKKKCATNTVAWERVKPEVVVTRSTIWSDQSGTNAEFNQRERERLERVFERMQISKSRLAAAQKRTRNISVDRRKGIVTVTGLTEKRALNLGIVLARFRPLSMEQLIQKIGSEAISELHLDYLSSLQKHFPAPDELAYFAKIKSGENLKDAELFCFLAARKPYLKLRIELKVLADNIATDLARQLDCVRMLLIATDELYNCTSVNTFFHRCLQYGNFLNQSTFAADASGFALSSLLIALNTKGNGAASNTLLVDILAEYADDKLRAVMQTLEFLEPAKKYSIDDLEKSEVSLRRSLEMSLKSLQECGDAELYAHYSPIIMDSITKCGQLSRSIKKVRHNENRLKEFYCASTMSLENILEILYQAFKLFQDALNRVDARAARNQRMREQRASAGRDAPDATGSMRRKGGQNETFERPNVKDLIEIINSNECR